jgi:hypothetical protein
LLPGIPGTFDSSLDRRFWSMLLPEPTGSPFVVVAPPCVPGCAAKPGFETPPLPGPCVVVSAFVFGGLAPLSEFCEGDIAFAHGVLSSMPAANSVSSLITFLLVDLCETACRQARSWARRLHGAGCAETLKEWLNELHAAMLRLAALKRATWSKMPV